MRQLSFSIVLRQAASGTLAAAALLAGPAAQAGSIEAAEFKSATLQRSWTYNVYLPTGYDAQSRLRYPVMYLLHGNDGQRNDWPVKGNLLRTVDQLIQNGEIPPAIIVMPDAGTTWYVDLKEPMETAFFQDLVPMSRRSTAPSPAAMAASSAACPWAATARCATCSSTPRNSRPPPC